MNLRDLSLPPGWFPRSRAEIERFLEPFAGGGLSLASAMAPHAGWYYSGIPAAIAVSSLDAEAETVAIVGGHLPRGMPILQAGEDGVRTPLGVMPIDAELRAAFSTRIRARPDSYEDNTVEALLPMVHYFFPKACLLWLRFPADLSSFEAGKLLADAASSLGKKIAVLASTDLTHYGPNYGFSPHGRGRPALEWVMKVNDAAFIRAVLEGNPSRVLERAESDRSACSAGAALGALGFAASLKGGRGNAQARLLDYRSSADAGKEPDEELPDDEVPDSFVGYAAMALG